MFGIWQLSGNATGSTPTVRDWRTRTHGTSSSPNAPCSFSAPPSWQPPSGRHVGHHGHEPNSIAMLLSGAARAMGLVGDRCSGDADCPRSGLSGNGGGYEPDHGTTQAPPRGRRYLENDKPGLLDRISPESWANADRSLVRGDRVSRDMGDRRMIYTPLVGIHPPAVLRVCYCPERASSAPVAGLRPGAGTQEQGAGTTGPPSRHRG